MMKKLCLLMISLVVLAACGGTEEATPFPTATLVETAVLSQANTTTPPATETAVPPATPTLAPPPTITPIATIAPSPTPAATVIALLAPEDFGDNRNPLTGELVDDSAVLQRRPLAVKISNSPAEFVRPQSGLNDADIIFEHTTEGQITRFTAIFYDTAPKKLGRFAAHV